MNDPTLLRRMVVVSALCVMTTLVYLPGKASTALFGQIANPASFLKGDVCPEDLLCVHFLDVGQGDAIFIEAPHGSTLLIDGGPDSSVLRELGKVLGFFDRNIDYVLATHPDQDHIGGLVDVFDRYVIDNVLLTENVSDTPVSDAFSVRTNDEGAVIHYARSTDTFPLGVGEAGTTTLQILFPDRDPSLFESNTASIVAELRYGDTAFLFTGDSPQSVEVYLTELYGSGLHSDVLKVGHHGSKTSSAPEFLAAVDPEYAVISSGEGNSYGHPHKEVLDRLKEYGASVVSTVEEGTITFVTDGRELWMK